MAVSTLTCALSFFDSETYPLLEMVWPEMAATRCVEARSKPALEVAGFRQRREACRNEFAAMLGILLEWNVG